MDTMKAVIIENEEDAISLLATLIDEYLPHIKIVGTGGTVKEGIAIIKDQKPDLIFLDISLDDGDGFEILDHLESNYFNVIFTTAYDEYAIKAFKYNAVDYLLKPFSIEDLINAVNKVSEIEEKELLVKRVKHLIKHLQGISSGKIPFHTSDGISIYHIKHIVRIEADRSYCFLHTDEGKKIMLSRPMKEISEILPENIFFKVHKSHIINLNFVSQYIKEDGGRVMMNNGDHVPVSRRRKEDFLDILTGI